MKIFYFAGNCGPQSQDPVKRAEFALIQAISQRSGWTIDSSIHPSPGLEHCIAHNYNMRIDWRKEQDWEKDPQEVERVDKIVEDIEQNLGISLRRCIYADRHLNRTYTYQSHRFPVSPMWRYARVKSTHPEIIIRRLIAKFDKVVEDSRPDAVVMHSFAGASNLVLALLCEYRRIPYFNITNAATTYQRFFIRQHYLFHNNPRLVEAYNALRKSGVAPSVEAQKYCAEFQGDHGNFLNWDDIYKNPRLASLSFLYNLRQLYLGTRQIVGRRIRQLLGEKKRYFLSSPNILKKRFGWMRAAIRFKTRAQSLMFYRGSDEVLARTSYVYLPLHQDPEEMLMTGAPIWGEAINVVEMVSKMIPFGYKLFVRDHIDNLGIRPPGFYEHLRRIPGVVLVTPVGSAIRFIKHADLVITIHGSTGWEGLLLKRPVITLSNTFYDLTGLTYKVDDINNLDRCIRTVLDEHQKRAKDEESYYHNIGLLIDADRSISCANQEKAVNDAIARIEEVVGAQ